MHSRISLGRCLRQCSLVKLCTRIILCLIIVFAVVCIVSCSSSNGLRTNPLFDESTTQTSDASVQKTAKEKEKKAHSPYSASDCVNKKKEDVINDFRRAGFNDISENLLSDLTVENFDKNGFVESVSINGIKDFSGNTKSHPPLQIANTRITRRLKDGLNKPVLPIFQQKSCMILFGVLLPREKWHILQLTVTPLSQEGKSITKMSRLS